MVLLDVAFQPPRASFTPYFTTIVIEVKASGPSHLLNLWLGVSKGMLPAKHLCTTKPLFMPSEFHEDHSHKFDVNIVTLSFGDIWRLNSVVSVRVGVNPL